MASLSFATPFCFLYAIVLTFFVSSNVDVAFAQHETVLDYTERRERIDSMLDELTQRIVIDSIAMRRAEQESDSIGRARALRGDTLAMHFTELAGFLPDSIDGLARRGRWKGSTTNTNQVMESQVTQIYRPRISRRRGVRSITLMLSDLSRSESAFGALGMLCAERYESDDEFGYQWVGPLTEAMTFAQLQYDKRENRTIINALTRYRFLITLSIESDANESERARTLALQLVRRFADK
jgi:hypothetical protein